MNCFFRGKDCFTLLFGLFFSCILWSQQPVWKAERIREAPRIDGALDEEIWHQQLKKNSFIVHEPNPGKRSEFQTEVAILYDDAALYVGARLHDPRPDSILTEYTPRDKLEHTDWFFFMVGPYRDGQNAFEFRVTPVDIQFDARYTTEGEDVQWDGVWEADASITSGGWIVEMKIPYAALRFPNTPNQLWEMNVGRYIRRIRQESYWAFVDPEESGFVNQSGLLAGIEDISPPTRLQFVPYVSGHLSREAENTGWEPNWGAGLDLKYGISEAFTLDMTVIPDFSQVAPDDEVLNLSPFETEFEERRPFFTEGIELFNKTGLFYSRRVAKSSTYQRLEKARLREAGFTFSEPVKEPRLINAAKVTGRTESGTGIGFFNAVTAEQTAVVQREGSEEKVIIDPLTNFNTLVIDQNLKNNSFINFTNTNVLREGSAYDANVSGTEFAFYDTTRTYRWRGGANLSQQYFAEESRIGHQYNFAFEKVGGNVRFTSGFYIESDRYNTNDLGFLSSNNEKNGFLGLDYVRFRPLFGFTRMDASLRADYQRHYEPDVFRSFDLSFNSFFMTERFFAFGLNGTLQPVEGRDYFEARTTDFTAYYAEPKNFSAGGFISTDYRRDLAVDLSSTYTGFDEEDRYGLSVEFSPRVRISDRMFFILSASHNYESADVGFVSPDPASAGFSKLSEDDIIFGQRDRNTTNLVFEGRYVFSARLSLELRLRHYWSKVEYSQFYLLGSKGGLNQTQYRGQNAQGASLHDLRFNSYATNMVFRWRFAPGSDLLFVWKNSLETTYTDPENDGYWQDFDRSLQQPKDNILSLKGIFYLDYYTFTGKREVF